MTHTYTEQTSAEDL